MKIAAVLVPLAIFLLPIFSDIPLAITSAIKGKDIYSGSHRLTASTRKKFLALICIYWCVFAASISWSIYVFSSNIWLSVSIGLIWALIFLIPILIAILKASKNPAPPPEKYPEPKTELEAENRSADRLYARLEKPNNIFGWFMVGWVILVIVLLIILIIIVFTVGRE